MCPPQEYTSLGADGDDSWNPECARLLDHSFVVCTRDSGDLLSPSLDKFAGNSEVPEDCSVSFLRIVSPLFLLLDTKTNVLGGPYTSTRDVGLTTRKL